MLRRSLTGTADCAAGHAPGALIDTRKMVSLHCCALVTRDSDKPWLAVRQPSIGWRGAPGEHRTCRRPPAGKPRERTVGQEPENDVNALPGADFRPLLRGLPGDLCHCPHWGYVLAGSIHLRYADGTEEVSRAGDAYYWPAGHTGWTEEGVTFLEFSPATELRPVLEHLTAQLSPSA